MPNFHSSAYFQIGKKRLKYLKLLEREAQGPVRQFDTELRRFRWLVQFAGRILKLPPEERNKKLFFYFTSVRELETLQATYLERVKVAQATFKAEREAGYAEREALDQEFESHVKKAQAGRGIPYGMRKAPSS